MNHSAWLYLIYNLFAWAQFGYNIVSPVLMIVKGLAKQRTVNTIWVILKYLALGNVLFGPGLALAVVGHLSGLDAVVAVFNAIIWWYYRNSGDDDEWKKKLKRRLAEKVQQLGGKLVVVPQGA